MKHTIGFILLLVTACSSREERPSNVRSDGTDESRCQKAVGHVTRLLTAAEPHSEGERAAMGGIALASLARCEADGLNEEQLQCILSAGTPQALMELGKCPAIAAKQPSWLTLPPALEDDQ